MCKGPVARKSIVRSFVQLKKASEAGEREVEAGQSSIGLHRPWYRVCLYSKSCGQPLRAIRGRGMGEV